jgi:hypothetical protein
MTVTCFIIILSTICFRLISFGIALFALVHYRYYLFVQCECQHLVSKIYVLNFIFLLTDCIVIDVDNYPKIL